jgi:murein L,D-transpeptidase YafK
MAESSNVASKRNQAGSRQPLLQAVVAIALAGSTYVWSMSFLPSKETLTRHLSIPEAMLVSALIEISENRIGTALEQIENLLTAKPDFRLAQLIKGDLLLARARPIDTVGAGSRSDHVADLREEARARIARSTFQPPADLTPVYLLELPPEQKYALVLDTSKSTLFVFENLKSGPRYVADYYISVGKNGADKLREGDKKTPLGVYHVTSKMPRQKLTDFYGAGAFPINYPNEWDRLRGRNGYGIWLHGTPFDTYSRPPRASDGCVVLANEDLDDLEKYLQPGRTPVIIAESIEWTDRKAVSALRDELRRDIDTWRKDWESRDTETYLKHYSKRFTSGSTGFQQWATQKRQVNSAKSWIKVGISDTSVFLYPGESTLAVVTFEQDYSSNNLSNKMRKRQYWVREGERWKILYEGSA